MIFRKYTQQQLIDAVNTSTSYRQVLNKLHVKEAGGNYACLKRKIQELNLDISHFTGKGWSKNKKIGNKRSIDCYLTNPCKYLISTYKLKRRLLIEGFFEYKCCYCQLSMWQNKPIPLELHHIDGNSNNNLLNNLTLLCPNCHALTPNYRSKNKKNIQ